MTYSTRRNFYFVRFGFELDRVCRTLTLYTPSTIHQIRY